MKPETDDLGVVLGWQKWLERKLGDSDDDGCMFSVDMASLDAANSLSNAMRRPGQYRAVINQQTVDMVH